MQAFNYYDQHLHAEQVPIATIVAEVGTPCYIYSQQAILHQWQVFTDALASHPHKLCYAVKANGNLAILNLLAKQGASFDIVSGGELARIIAAGGKTQSVVFSGVGKTKEELLFALKNQIYCFNIESEQELALLAQLAAHLNVQANIAVRVNPEVDPLSHPYIATGLKESKFGIEMSQALALYRQAQNFKHLKIQGVACHIGSQITSLSPFNEACEKMLDLIGILKEHGIIIHHLDLGGGLGVAYQNETLPSISDYANSLINRLPPKLTLLLEPGRAIIAQAGILVTKVLFLKQTGSKHYCIIDAGMNDLIRPALYDAWHDIIPVKKIPNHPVVRYDVVGPICENSDFLGKDRQLQVAPSDLLAIKTVGAYGFACSSNYPSRPRSCEVMVDSTLFKTIRERETYEALFSQERIW